MRTVAGEEDCLVEWNIFGVLRGNVDPLVVTEWSAVAGAFAVECEPLEIFGRSADPGGAERSVDLLGAVVECRLSRWCWCGVRTLRVCLG